jgi:hypothetical protein
MQTPYIQSELKLDYHANRSSQQWALDGEGCHFTGHRTVQTLDAGHHVSTAALDMGPVPCSNGHSDTQDKQFSRTEQLFSVLNM